MATGRPIQLTTLDADSERFHLNANIMKEMQSADRLLRSKVAVVSVAGAFRKGKSFLLSFFLRFLRALVKGDTRDWIRSSPRLDDGFPWRGGIERDTTGILVWSEPFFIRKPNGEEVAVLLMDTQGTFDHQSSQKDCTTIFAFSTLLSSVQIFNISQNIQETDLQHLRLFVEFAAMASNSQEQVLQHLWFLIRDWQNPDDFEFGVNGGSHYLKKVLSCDADKPTENQELRNGIARHFQQTFCCLLPYPGRSVTRRDFEGRLSELEPDFVQEIEAFVTQLLSPQSLITKAVNGRELTGQELFNNAQVYFEAFRSGRLPSPKTIFAATVDMANSAVVGSAKDQFAKTMEMHASSAEPLDEGQLEEALNGALLGSLELFDSNCMQKDSAATRQCRARLEEDLTKEFGQHRLVNQLKSERVAQEEKYKMLAENMESLQRDNIEATRKMRELDAEYQEKLRDIMESTMPKEEMQRMFEQEAMRHRLAQQEQEVRQKELVSQLEMMAERTGNLQQQLKDSQEERKRYEAMEERRREKESAERERLQSQIETTKTVKEVLGFLCAVTPLAIGALNTYRASNQPQSQEESRGTGTAPPGGGTAPSGTRAAPFETGAASSGTGTSRQTSSRGHNSTEQQNTGGECKQQ